MSNDAAEITPGTGLLVATRKNTESTVDKHWQRFNLDDPTGAPVPFPASLGANGGFKMEGVPGGTAVNVAGTVSLTDYSAGEYETVAASATDQALGPTGATGDFLVGLLIVPATTSPGAVSIKDGAGSAITVFTGGATSVSNLVPFYIPLGLKSLAGAWKVSTGTNVSAVASGNFT